MTNQQLIQIVKDQMAKNGMTAYRVSVKSGVSQSTMHRWLKGTYNITVPILCLILEAVELELDVKEIKG